ncbi:MAG: CerR family C-terminal domain-containing protein [Pseudomonadota bacterium]
MNRAAGQARERLLSSATELFAEHGKNDVSVRQIADQAGVSHGSIRYHFGSKDKLYEQAVSQVDGFRKATPTPVQAPPLMSRSKAERALRTMITKFTAFQARLGKDRVAAEGMMRTEVTQDGGPEPTFFNGMIRPGHNRMKHIIQSLRPDIQNDKTLEILAFNVIFQCLMVRIGQGTILRLFESDRLTDEDVRQIAELIYATTLNGIDGLAGTAGLDR